MTIVNMNNTKAIFLYNRIIYIQWKLGFAVLFLFFLLVLGNSDSYQRNVGLLIFVCLTVYGAFLYSKFFKDPSEISIANNTLTLKFRKAPQKSFKHYEIEYIKKSNNPFLDYVKGKLEIKIKNSNERYRISGNIQNFDNLLKVLSDSGFEIRK